VLSATEYRCTRPCLTPAGQTGRLLDLSTPEGWKAELTLVLVIYLDGFTRTAVVTSNTADTSYRLHYKSVPAQIKRCVRLSFLY